MRAVGVTASTPDGEAFDEFARREHGAVLALGLAVLRDVDEARDIAQEVMVRTLAHWEQVATLERPGAWSRRVALNLITDRLRDRRRRRVLLDRLSGRSRQVVAAPDEDPWDASLWVAVAQLPERQRSAIALHYVLDLGVDEIADVLQTPSGTVKSDLARARAALARRPELGR